MQDGELTKKGFIELNQMEADDNEGDVEDLWVTLNFMGYNKLLELDEVSANLLVKPRLIINIIIIKLYLQFSTCGVHFMSNRSEFW